MQVSLSELGHGDLILLLELVDQSRLVKRPSDVTVLLTRLCDHLSTDGVVGGIFPPRPKKSSLKTSIHPSLQVQPRLQNIVVSNLHNAGYSDEWLKEYERNKYFLCDPTKSARLAGHDFFKWSYVFGKAESESEKSYIRKARQYNICQGITVGSHNGGCDRITWFSFLGAGLEENCRDQAILQYIGPYLHEAMCASMLGDPSRVPMPNGPAPDKTTKSLLSERETEVLTWAMAGKTNWEISVILSISERTVKFHVQNLMMKLEASSRAHAVAIALGLGLICH